ncbi:MAG TPA: hypothetical protein VKB31_03080 [Trueperaceae bacterium]|nr:hypothetical protein [Trueperaceae bacterium]
MGRRIVTARIATEERTVAPADVADSYFDRLLKYIPADVVAAYVVVEGLLPGARNGGVSGTAPPLWLTWGLVGVFMVLTAIWTYRQTRTRATPSPATMQVVIATASFLVWAFALGNEPFASLGWYMAMPYLGSIVLVVFTLAVAGLVPKD